MNKIQFLTDRTSSKFFLNRLNHVAREAGIEFEPSENLDPNNEAKWFALDYWKKIDSPKDKVVISLNEDPLPYEEQGPWSGVIRFSISQAEHLRGAFMAKNYKPSAIVDHPFCCPRAVDLPTPGSTAPVKILIPSYRDWTQANIIQLVPKLAMMLSRDFGSLEDFEFVVESDPFPYRSVAGESITFYDNDGTFLGRLLDSKIVATLSSEHIMEMSWLSRMRSLGITSTLLFAENLMTSKMTSEFVLKQIQERGQKSYSHIKLTWAADQQVVFDEGAMRHMVSFASISGKGASPFVSVFSADLGKLISAKPTYNKEKAADYCIAYEDRVQMMSSKLAKIQEKVA